MHAASIKKSKRLQSVLEVLTALKEASTLQLVQIAGVCAVNSCVAELREAGYLINCQRRAGAFYYSLIGQTIGGGE